MNKQGQPVYRLNGVEIDTSRFCLKRDGEERHLRQQTFQVLIYLLEQRERLVTKDELIERVTLMLMKTVSPMLMLSWAALMKRSRNTSASLSSIRITRWCIITLPKLTSEKDKVIRRVLNTTVSCKFGRMPTRIFPRSLSPGKP